MNEILLQTMYYAIVMVLSLGISGFLLRGFFWKFIKVKLSFGKLILVKIKAVNRDYFRVGKIDENDLIYKTDAGEKRVTIPDNSVFYRVMGTTWIDVDDQKNSIAKPNNEAVSGYDAVKQNNLLVRALTGPELNDNHDRIMIGIGVLLIIGLVALAFLYYKQGLQIELIANSIGNLNKGVLVAGG